MKINRRDFLKSSSALLGSAAVGTRFQAGNISAHIKNSKIANKVIVLGLDGMDPNLLWQMMQEGAMPNFKRLAELGFFGKLKTTMPPQSPVAWASFITGTNPGGHGIFDFIHRDPAKFLPYLSTSRSYDSKRKAELGKWSVPLSAGKVDSMRKGTAFWEVLDAQDIPTTIFALPSNFPVVPCGNVKAISGMGTPDLLGGYGRYTMFSEKEISNAKDLSSGQVVKITLSDHATKARLGGPKNPFRNDKTYASVEFAIRRDPVEPVVKIDIQDHSIILKQGEWSEWLPLSFEFVPMFSSTSGIARFYVKSVHPHLLIYCSPVNIDPMDATLPICSPASYSKEIAQAIGRFYTQGLPADTKALSEGSLDSAEFFQQSKLVLFENLAAYDDQLARFDEGCFVFYFSSIDQNSHMLWRCMDPSHPLYEPNASVEVKNAIKFLYKTMDMVLGKALAKVDNYTTLMVLSDHGFTTFTREFNLSTWLVDNGFTSFSEPQKMEQADFYQYVDWRKTKAYALGINGIYINLQERERNGTVSPNDALRIKEEIIAKLSQVTDPANGKKMIRTVYDSTKLYSGPHMQLAPDLLVGYEAGYRISDESILGKFQRPLVRDRTDKWSADHCMDPAAVPGIILSNKDTARPKDDIAIWDLAPTILKAFGIAAPETMHGKSLI